MAMMDPEVARLDLERKLRRVLVLTRAITGRSEEEQMVALRTANHWMNRAVAAFEDLVRAVEGNTVCPGQPVADTLPMWGENGCRR
jgi:hypothetical protein